MATKKTRGHFTPEYKAEVVRLVRGGSKKAGEVSRDLGLTETSVRAWVRQAEIDEGKGSTGALTTAEREELTALKREVKTLRLERDILKNTHGRRPTCWKRNSAALRATSGLDGVAGCFLEFCNPLKNMVQGALRTW
jgi:transposase